ncbi:putative choline-phosphate cytidylyltransferase [Cucumispora dikerogammari]|nr:putative choline-phosphate cytidylyltransferase [Cucumispora dikerogammari]
MDVLKKLIVNILKHIEKPKNIKPPIEIKPSPQIDLTPVYLNSLIHNSSLTKITTEYILRNNKIIKKMKKMNIKNTDMFILNVECYYKQLSRIIIYLLSKHCNQDSGYVFLQEKSDTNHVGEGGQVAYINSGYYSNYENHSDTESIMESIVDNTLKTPEYEIKIGGDDGDVIDQHMNSNIQMPISSISADRESANSVASSVPSNTDIGNVNTKPYTSTDKEILDSPASIVINNNHNSKKISRLIYKLCLEYFKNDEIARKKILFIASKFDFISKNDVELDSSPKDTDDIIKKIVKKAVRLITYKNELCLLLFPSYESLNDEESMTSIVDNFDTGADIIISDNKYIPIPKIFENQDEFNNINNRKIDLLNLTAEQEHAFLSIFSEKYQKPSLSDNDNMNQKIIYNYTNAPFPVPLFTSPTIYCDGVYDLFHYGHSRLLLQAKTLFPCVRLIVGVTSDKDTFYHKGITAMNAKDRAESVRHCKYVDSVISNCVWVLNEEYLSKYGIWYVVHDDEPYAVKIEPKPNNNKHKRIKLNPDIEVVNTEDCSSDLYAPLKNTMRFICSNRTPGISTSGLIKNLLVNYENFVERNVNRGMTAKDLNISRLKFNFIKLKALINEKIRDMKKEFRCLKTECIEAIQLWEEYRELIMVKVLRLLDDMWAIDDDDD